MRAHSLGASIGLAIALAATPASADDQVGVLLGVMPAGTMTLATGAGSVSADTATTFALAAYVDHAASRNVYFGLAPQYVFKVADKADPNGDDAARELDLMARVIGVYPVADSFRLYAYVAGGYSIIFPPSSANISRPAGPVIAFTGGAQVFVSSNVFLSLEGGYQLGFQSTTNAGISTDVSTRFLRFALGLGTRL